MNPKTEAEATEIIKQTSQELEKIDLKDKKIIICPSFLYLSLLKKFKSDKIELGAHDLSFKKEESLTGEISGCQLNDIGVKYVIIGHAERRINFFETDEIINKKIKIALENSLIPIFCIGESLKDKEKEGSTIEVLKQQIEKGLRGILDSNNKIIIAYEPVWAIGKGITPTYYEINKIKNELQTFLKKTNFNFSIIYGGSVNIDNAKGFIEESKMDGLLIGKKSLDFKSFVKIIKSI